MGGSSEDIVCMQESVSSREAGNGKQLNKLDFFFSFCKMNSSGIVISDVRGGKLTPQPPVHLHFLADVNDHAANSAGHWC